METIKEVLIRRDGMSAADADALIEETRSAIVEYLEEGLEESAYNVCEEFFGLEPDYLDEIMPL